MESYRVFSQEVRWFFEGSLAQAAGVESWFLNCRPPFGDQGTPVAVFWPESWASHRYLVIPGMDNMGIKWRHENGKLGFQVKGRVTTLGAQRFTTGASGVTERWVKWSYDGAEAGILFKNLVGEKGIVQVEKLRLQRRVRFDMFGADREVPAADEKSRIDRGLEVELTRLRLGEAEEDTHWTLGFEAFPDDSQINEAFYRTVCGFLADFPVELRLESSMSYPGWLNLPR